MVTPTLRDVFPAQLSLSASPLTGTPSELWSPPWDLLRPVLEDIPAFQLLPSLLENRKDSSELGFRKDGSGCLPGVH